MNRSQEIIKEKITADTSYSKARCLRYAGLTVLNKTPIGNMPLDGTHTGNGVVNHWHDGMLDDSFDANGTRIPAVETSDGHVEFWEQGVLHNEGGPAVISDYGNWEEYWYYGKLLKIISYEHAEINKED